MNEPLSQNSGWVRGESQTVVCAEVGGNGEIKRIHSHVSSYKNWPGMVQQGQTPPLAQTRFVEVAQYNDRHRERFPEKIQVYRADNGEVEPNPFLDQSNPKIVGKHLVYKTEYNRCVYEKASYENPDDSKAYNRVFRVKDAQGKPQRLVVCDGSDSSNADQPRKDFFIADQSEPYCLENCSPRGTVQKSGPTRTGQSQTSGPVLASADSSPLLLSQTNRVCQVSSGEQRVKLLIGEEGVVTPPVQTPRAKGTRGLKE